MISKPTTSLVLSNTCFYQCRHFTLHRIGTHLVWPPISPEMTCRSSYDFLTTYFGSPLTNNTWLRFFYDENEDWLDAGVRNLGFPLTSSGGSVSEWGSLYVLASTAHLLKLWARTTCATEGKSSQAQAPREASPGTPVQPPLIHLPRPSMLAWHNSNSLPSGSESS